MEEHLKEHISTLLGIKLNKVLPISGGDISKSYCLFSQSDRFFCKTLNGSHAMGVFEAEKEGLKALGATRAVAVPHILGCFHYKKTAFLIMEYIEAKSPTDVDFETLGNQLGDLHRNVSDYFGWENDNFIGSLVQSNKKYKEWTSFYVHERLLPQFRLAQKSTLPKEVDIPSKEILLKRCRLIFENVRPSLIHGDLWRGNFLIASSGKPYLIDPAVYFGHGEVDMAMTRLFGGFSPRFYQAYAQHFEPHPFAKEQNDIYQLYYLLVHLNLFGGSYYGSVKTLLKRYFG